jgi:hypothetical protein
MEQRSLRLGDIVDDYCPRERRLTNHVIVAIVEDAIRQTRCTTCDYEHAYKQAREPRRRKKPTESLYDQVLADVSGAQLVAARAAAAGAAPAVVEAAAIVADSADTDVPADDDASASDPVEEGGGAHRTLIRATLPKTSDEPPPPRPIPEFTMHQKPQSRARHVRFAYGPQGDPFGRPTRGSGHGSGRGGDGNTAGPGPGNDEPGARRGRRRRGGKRSR